MYDIAHIQSTCCGRIEMVAGGQEMTDRLVRQIIGMPEPEHRAVVPVEAALLQALRAAGIDQAGDGDHLTVAQEDALLHGRTVQQRIQLKMLCERAGITPRGH